MAGLQHIKYLIFLYISPHDQVKSDVEQVSINPEVVGIVLYNVIFFPGRQILSQLP